LIISTAAYTASVRDSISLPFQIRIWNHRFEKAQKLTEELIVKGKSAVAYQSAEECVKDADVIVTATFASSPILKGKWVKPGAHINGM
jgi:ornithine cyclodeaminase/alanine dehydrogenase-like protein (mu-crystallin family)